MKDANLARRMRIANGLMVAMFLVGACVLALVAGDILAGLSGMALFSLGWALAVLWLDHPALLPGGRLLIREKRVLQVAASLALGLGFCATVLAVGNAHTAAVIVLAVAGVLAVATGAFSVWLAVR